MTLKVKFILAVVAILLFSYGILIAYTSHLQNRLVLGQDIFGRNARFIQVRIDDTFPKYLREHQEEYAHLIKQEESRGTIVKRHIRKKCRRWYRTVMTGMKRVVKHMLHLNEG